MKAILAAAAVAAMMTTTAQAGVFCTLLHVKDLKQVEYTFEPGDEGRYVEMRVSRNGEVLNHHQGRRPLWDYIDYGDNNTYSSALSYNIDPRWKLMVKHDGERLNKAQAMTNVILTHDTNVIAIGACLITVAGR